MSTIDARVGAREHARRLFWTAMWLAVALIAIKAYHLGRPSLAALWIYVRSLAAISHADVVFAAVVWAAGRLLLSFTVGRPVAARMLLWTLTALAAFFC